ncbi:MAG: PQQ-binding-like beta-propeller repeat protein, partial [Verrucomicrobiota bacterium]
MRLVCSLPIWFLTAYFACSATADEWTRFRGPNGSGISSATGIPVTWTTEDYNWQVDLPVQGSSSPVLWKKWLYLTGDDVENGHRSILCIDANNGRIQWRRDYDFERHYLHRDNDFASATPCVDQDGVIIVWSTPEQVTMTALSLDGEEQWSRDLGPFKGLHGTASSPIIADGLVVFANDQMDPSRFFSSRSGVGESFLIALDRKTGETRWKIDRKTELAGYATP